MNQLVADNDCLFQQAVECHEDFDKSIADHKDSNYAAKYFNIHYQKSFNLTESSKKYLEESIYEISKLRIQNNIPNFVMDEIGKAFVKIFTNLDTDDRELKTTLGHYLASTEDQDEFIKHLPTYVPPTVRNIGKYKFHYVSLEKLARPILTEELVNLIEEEKSQLFVQNKVSWSRELDTCDETRFNRLNGKLRIEAYYDEYTIGLARNPRKYVAAYVSNGNTDLSVRSKRADSNLLLLANYYQLKQHNLTTNDLFSIFDNELKLLGTNGIVFHHSSGRTTRVKVVLSRFLGNNLGIYTLLGFQAVDKQSIRGERKLSILLIDGRTKEKSSYHFYSSSVERRKYIRRFLRSF